jgi:hypothetical protein
MTAHAVFQPGTSNPLLLVLFKDFSRLVFMASITGVFNISSGMTDFTRN